MSRKRRSPSGRDPSPDAKPPVKLLSIDAVLATVLLFATLIAYWPALQGGLLWDDAGHVTRPEMQSLHGLWRTWFDVGSTAQYYPLLHTAFWIEHRLWADHLAGYHLLNVLLHVVAALLGDFDLPVRGDQRVDEIDARLGPMCVRVRKVMAPGRGRRDFRGCS